MAIISNPTGAAALRRKVERLEAQLDALKSGMKHGYNCDINVVLQRADMARRIEQAVAILQGKDE